MKTVRHRLLPVFLAVVALLALRYFGALPAIAQGTDDCAPTVTVINPVDSGPGTLRQAILDVCDGGVIDFALP